MAAKKSTSKSTPKKSSASISISSPSKMEMRKWEIESAVNTLQRAAEIQKNTKLMADVKKMAAEKAKEFNNIAGGKKI